MKLSDAHLNEIFRLRAEGIGFTEIARWLTDSSKSGLPPVSVDESAVRWRCRSSEAESAINDWRLRLYGGVFESRSSFAAWRLEQLELLLLKAHEGASDATDDAGRRSYSRLALSISKEIRTEMDRLGEQHLPNRVHITKDSGETASVESPELARLIDDLVGAIS